MLRWCSSRAGNPCLLPIPGEPGSLRALASGVTSSCPAVYNPVNREHEVRQALGPVPASAPWLRREEVACWRDLQPCGQLSTCPLGHDTNVTEEGDPGTLVSWLEVILEVDQWPMVSPFKWPHCSSLNFQKICQLQVTFNIISFSGVGSVVRLLCNLRGHLPGESSIQIKIGLRKKKKAKSYY